MQDSKDSPQRDRRNESRRSTRRTFVRLRHLVLAFGNVAAQR